MNAMKNLSLTVILSCVLMFGCGGERAEPGNSDTSETATATDTAADEAAIEAAYDDWYKAWETKDFKLAAKHYSADAIWVNAFGMKRVGRKAIEEALQQVFGMDFVMAGDSATIEKSVNFIRPDVALVSSRVERKGQKMPDGTEMPVRQTSHLRVFAKKDGNWQIANHLISDARDREGVKQ